MRREGEGWRLYRGNTPCRPGGRQAPLPRSWAGPIGRPRGGRQAPLSPVGGATGPLFFLQGFRWKFEEKKLHFGHVALWEGDQGIFLKFSKTNIYF